MHIRKALPAIAFAFVAAMVLGACVHSGSTGATHQAESGEYGGPVAVELAGKNDVITNKAESVGYGGPIVVELAVKNGVIASIVATGSYETAAIGGEAIGVYNRRVFKALVGKALDSVNFDDADSISGATVSVMAIKDAAKAAARKALGLAEPRKSVNDSVAVIPAIAHSLTKKMMVEVTLKDDRIASVVVKDSGETPGILKSVTDLLVPRIIEHQSLGVDAITGATVTSNGLKGAIATAIDLAGGDSSEWKQPVAKKQGLVKLEGYDVIVVGLGGSGMAAYASAAEHGAKVFGLDSAGKVGGTSTNVSGPMAINPPDKMAAENGGKKWLEEEDLIQDWIEYTKGDAKESILRSFVNESGSTMDWLVTKLGFAFNQMRAFFHPKGWVVWATYKGDKDGMYNAAMQAAKARNPKNDYKLELKGTELIVKGGKIVGVKAEYYDGTSYEIYGDSVILATGGFIGNSEMKKKYLGGDYNVEGMMQDDGGGIKMALAVGAATYNISMPPMVHIAQTKTLIRDDVLDPNEKAVLRSLVLKSDTMIVDAKGQRYMNEAGNIAFDNWKGGPVYYSIYSKTQIDSYRTEGMAIVVNPPHMSQGGKIDANKPISTIDRILEVGEQRGIVFRGATLEELAAKLGAPQLPGEARKYSSYAAGTPDPLGKKADLIKPLDQGPFVAIAGAGYTYGTCGGLDIDENLNVLKTDGKPIPNLYAIGQDSMGVLFTEKDAYVTYGGAAHGWVLTSGRLAGARAASLFK